MLSSILAGLGLGGAAAVGRPGDRCWSPLPIYRRSAGTSELIDALAPAAAALAVPAYRGKRSHPLVIAPRVARDLSVSTAVGLRQLLVDIGCWARGRRSGGGGRHRHALEYGPCWRNPTATASATAGLRAASWTVASARAGRGPSQLRNKARLMTMHPAKWTAAHRPPPGSSAQLGRARQRGARHPQAPEQGPGTTGWPPGRPVAAPPTTKDRAAGIRAPTGRPPPDRAARSASSCRAGGRPRTAEMVREEDRHRQQPTRSGRARSSRTPVCRSRRHARDRSNRRNVIGSPTAVRDLDRRRGVKNPTPRPMAKPAHIDRDDADRAGVGRRRHREADQREQRHAAAAQPPAGSRAIPGNTASRTRDRRRARSCHRSSR